MIKNTDEYAKNFEEKANKKREKNIGMLKYQYLQRKNNRKKDKKSKNFMKNFLKIFKN